jgi:hypothetical protein
MIDRVSEPVLVTYTILAIEFTAARLAIRGNCVKIGIFNTGSPVPSTRRRLGLTVMLLVILFVLPSITDTVLDCMLVTYILLDTGFADTPTGLLPGNIGSSYQETKTLNSDKLTLIADDNNTFSDLSRNITIQTGS